MPTAMPSWKVGGVNNPEIYQRKGFYPKHPSITHKQTQTEGGFGCFPLQGLQGSEMTLGQGSLGLGSGRLPGRALLFPASIGQAPWAQSELPGKLSA